MPLHLGASIATANDGHRLRVYAQDSSGMIQEHAYDGKTIQHGYEEPEYEFDGSWRKGVQLVRAKLGTPLAAASSGRKQIRIYYVDNNNILNEICYSDTNCRWTVSRLVERGLKVSPSSGLAAMWNGGDPRIYAQLETNEIQEFGYAGGAWNKMKTFQDAYPNTSISIISNEMTRLYYVSKAGRLTEKGYGDSGWFHGEIHGADVPPNTPFVALEVGDGNRVYRLGSMNHIMEHRFERLR